MSLEVLQCQPAEPTGRLPVLFVHGTNCGAWVWQEHFLPYFASQGYAAYALSLSGHGGSHRREDLNWLGLSDYVRDLADVAARITPRPVLIGHSLGGLVVQKFIQSQKVPGAVLMASVPPSGLGPVAWRMGLIEPFFLQRVTLVQSLFDQAPGAFETVSEMLYSDDMPQAAIRAYFDRWQPESKRIVTDIMWQPLPFFPKRLGFPVRVVAAEKDRLVDALAARETARYYHTDVEMVPGIAHAMMLEPRWRDVADRILAWLDRSIGAPRSSAA